MARRGSCNWCSFVFKNLYALSPPLHQRTPTQPTQLCGQESQLVLSSRGFLLYLCCLAVNCRDLLFSPCRLAVKCRDLLLVLKELRVCSAAENVCLVNVLSFLSGYLFFYVRSVLRDRGCSISCCASASPLDIAALVTRNCWS
jgi:hypothetical protein